MRAPLYTLPVCLGLLAGPEPTCAGDATAEGILAEMKRVYGSCRTYRDEGKVVSAIRGGGTDVVGERPFTTAFRRNDRFRFEFREVEGRAHGVVWADDEGSHAWFNVLSDVLHFPTVDRALAGALGVSGGSAGTVPPLLLGSAFLRPVLDGLKQVRHEGEETVGGSTCHRIAARRDGMDYTFWIDARSHLLLKMRRKGSITGGIDVEDVVFYRPEVDVHLDEAEFTFERPAGP